MYQLDREKCSKDKRVLNSLEQGEQVLLSTTLWKFSHINKQQRRILLITNRNVYNVTPQSAITNFFAGVVSSLRVKRKIAITSIAGVSVSRCGYEFVIHVPEEYDYRFSSLDFRDKILQVLCEAYTKVNRCKMMFHITDDLNLTHHTTTKVDVKRGNRKSQINGISLDIDELIKLDMCQLDLVIKERIVQPFDISEYTVLKLLSQGCLSQIILVQKGTQLCVWKCMSKQEIITTDHLRHVQNERELLAQWQHPFLIKLIQAFETEDKIFFVLPFVQAGDLYQHLKISTRLREEVAKVYIAQIVLAFIYLHDRDIVYRDLKPENILIDSTGYLLLTDFALCKHLPQKKLTYSLAGTIEYLAPEILTATGYGKMVDWWTLGILTYELLIGITPFYSDNQSQILEAIQENEVKFPTSVALSSDAKAFIQALLVKDPRERLGSKMDMELPRKDSSKKSPVEMHDIQGHAWFKDINWTDLMNKKFQVPKPTLNDPLDLRYFQTDDLTLGNIDGILDQLQTQTYDQELVAKFNREFEMINYNV